MSNQSTIIGTRNIQGDVIATVNAPVVAGVRLDRADSQAKQPKHLGKRLHERRLPALSHRLAAVRSRHASAASYSCSAHAQAWQMRMPAGRPGPFGAPAPVELPASAWASLVLARAV
ncbi:MAG: hypothetical protein U0992_13825 [Planctomycetaceae bacterium]